MSNKIIQINKKEEDGYQNCDVVNNATSVGYSTQLDIKTNLSQALHSIANQSIASGGAYWNEINSYNDVDFTWHTIEGVVTRDGITYTIHQERDKQYVTTHGTATADSGFGFAWRGYHDLILEDKTYKLVGCPPGGSDNTYYLMADHSIPGVEYGRDYGNGEGLIFQGIAGTETGIWIQIKKGTTMNGEKWYCDLKNMSFNLEGAKMCNVGQFYVIARPTENPHKMTFFISDNCYRWKKIEHSNSNVETQINNIIGMEMVLTNLGYKLLIIGTNNLTPSNINCYNCYFIHDINIKNGTAIPFRIGKVEYLSTNLLTEDVKIFKNKSFLLMGDNTIIENSFLPTKTYIQGGLKATDNNNKLTLRTASSVVGTPIFAMHDKMIDKFVCYCENDIKFLNSNTLSNIYTAYYETDSSELMDVTQAFQRVISLHKTNNSNFVRFYSPELNGGNVSSSFQNFDIVLPSLTSGYWKYLIGNKYRLYIISTEGDIIYINYIRSNVRPNPFPTTYNYEYNIVNVQQDESSTKCLKKYKDLLDDVQFCCGEDNDDIVGIIGLTDDENSYKIIHTHVGNVI